MGHVKNMGRNGKSLKKRIAARTQSLLDEDDYYTYDDHCYEQDYGEEEEDFYGESPSDSTNRTPLTVDLLSVVQPRSVRKPKQSSKATTKSVVVVSVLPEKKHQTQDDPLAYLVTMKPRLVRSKSFTSERPCAPASLHRRSSSFTGLFPITYSDSAVDSPTVSPAVHCIQSLIPARPSVVGPSPRASLTVSASKCRAAVLLTWSLCALEPRVHPLVGCSEQAAQKMQHELQRRLVSNQETDTQAYWRMSCTVHARLDEWTELLEACLDGPAPRQYRWKNVSQACNKFKMTLGQCYSHYDMLQDFQDNVEENAKSETQEKGDDNDQVCLVCFEEIDANSTCQLVACGHMTCFDCSKSYLASAAASGQGNVKCAAYKCNVSVNFFDAAHILTETADRDTWDRLVRFALERSESPPGARFCPGADCGLLLKPTSVADSQHHGFNMLTCDCGINLCRDCNNEGHPGVTCTNFTKLCNAINSGKLDAEIANINWVMEHSRPCPKCRYPIEKNGGCNHVRCQQCDYYFCFQCGGEGQLCFAYDCHNPRKYWQDDVDYDDRRYNGISTLVDNYRAFRSTKAKLESLRKTLASRDGKDSESNNDHKDELLLEIQCHQVRMWLHTCTIARMMANEASVITGMLSLSLDLIIHAFSLRNLLQQTNVKHSQEALAAALGLALPKKRKSHCKKSSKGNVVEPQFSSFQKIFADQELEDLCRMDTTRLAKKIAAVIQEALQVLCPSTAKKSTRRKRKNEVVVDGSLNEKMERPNDPWRNGYRAKFTEEENNWSDDGNRGKKRFDRRWKKSKAVVTARRAKNLGLDEL